MHVLTFADSCGLEITTDHVCLINLYLSLGRIYREYCMYDVGNIAWHSVDYTDGL